MPTAQGEKPRSQGQAWPGSHLRPADHVEDGGPGLGPAASAESPPLTCRQRGLQSSTEREGAPPAGRVWTRRGTGTKKWGGCTPRGLSLERGIQDAREVRDHSEAAGGQTGQTGAQEASRFTVCLLVFRPPSKLTRPVTTGPRVSARPETGTRRLREQVTSCGGTGGK